MKFGRALSAAIIWSCISQSVWSETIVDKFSSGIEIAIHKKEFPSLPSTSSTVPISNEKPYQHLLAIFDRMKGTAKPAVDAFELKLVESGNLSCDRQRKFVLVDLKILSRFTKRVTDPDLVIAALFAHELSHYIFDIIMRDYPDHDGPLGPPPIMVEGKEIPFADYEHVNVEGLAAEMLWRAGFKLSEIKKAFDDLLTTVQEISNELKGDPSTDIQSRRTIVLAWLREKGLDVDAGSASQNEMQGK